MSDTEILYAVSDTGEPRVPGGYVLRRARCVVELSLRFARFPLLRGRFTATEGRFTIIDTEVFDADHEFVVVLDTASLRTRFFAKQLTRHAAEFPELVFSSREITVDGRAVEISGRIDLPSTTRALRLRGDLRYVDHERIVLWATGILPPTRRGPWIARRRIHVETAIEFVR